MANTKQNNGIFVDFVSALLCLRTYYLTSILLVYYGSNFVFFWALLVCVFLVLFLCCFKFVCLFVCLFVGGESTCMHVWTFHMVHEV